MGIASTKEARMFVIDSEALFHELNGSESSGFATIHSSINYSPGGIPYLLKPGVAIIARPNIHLDGLAGFLNGFDTSLHFSEYLDDPTPLPDGAQLCTDATWTLTPQVVTPALS